METLGAYPGEGLRRRHQAPNSDVGRNANTNSRPTDNSSTRNIPDDTATTASVVGIRNIVNNNNRIPVPTDNNNNNIPPRNAAAPPRRNNLVDNHPPHIRNNNADGGNRDSNRESLSVVHLYCLISFVIATLAVVTSSYPFQLLELPESGIDIIKNHEGNSDGEGFRMMKFSQSGKSVGTSVAVSDIAAVAADVITRAKGKEKVWKENDKDKTLWKENRNNKDKILEDKSSENGQKEDRKNGHMPSYHTPSHLIHGAIETQLGYWYLSSFHPFVDLLRHTWEYLNVTNVSSSESSTGIPADIAHESMKQDAKQQNFWKDLFGQHSHHKHKEGEKRELLKGIKGKHHKLSLDKDNKKSPSFRPGNKISPSSVLSFFAKFIDPSLLNYTRRLNATSADDEESDANTYSSSHIATEIIDKILTSTPRLMAIANLLLAVTYLLHTAVADLFLGSTNSNSNSGMRMFNANMEHNDLRGTSHHNRTGRERLGGFLIFKLLLISSVLSPDTLDLLILLSWYTLLAFLRSLAHLAIQTTTHRGQSGLPPSSGVIKLLLLVLGSDFLSALGCVGLFYGAGVGMVLLLIMDCVILGVDVCGYVMKYGMQVMEEGYGEKMNLLEERAMQRFPTLNQPRHEHEHGDDNGSELNLEEIDAQMERLSNHHTKRLKILEGCVFLCEIVSSFLTACHFLHIWFLHGLSFGLVDGVLALHLHSAISGASRKIVERRNLFKIARDLEGMFEDATELEMRKAHAAEDVCCICLGTMMSGGGNVKKVGCGHLYHAHCLREVVERASSIEAARCPLCRASLVDGQHHSHSNHTAAARNENLQPNRNAPNGNINNDMNRAPAGAGDNFDNDNPFANNAQQQQQQRGGGGVVIENEHSLFRFSTEGILPAWLPIPAFSFEVVRRPPIENIPPPQNVNRENVPVDEDDDARQDDEGNVDNEAPNGNNNEASFWRRLLLFAGAIPMSPEEEADALSQLVDMFPQYERADLLRELRDRGSTELVAESILMGLFDGLPTGVAGGGFDVVDMQRNMEDENGLHEMHEQEDDEIIANIHGDNVANAEDLDIPER